MGGADIAVTAISASSAIAVAYIAKQNRDIRQTAKSNQEVAADTNERVKAVATQTNGQLEAKIRKAVIEVFQEHKTEVTEAVMAESVRHLLDAMLNMPNETERGNHHG